jgi:glyoxylase-like metal-dependent hydrolase (beta-lactamase superfamily II)
VDASLQSTEYYEKLCSIADPSSIDFVCCTHLHADHIGWNTLERDGRWVPTFVNAKYIFSRTENDFWDPRKNPAMSGGPRHRAYEDSVLPIVSSGRAVLVDDGYEVDDVMRVVAALGHTPGHFRLDLKSDGRTAVLCGDVIHHAVQVLAPHWNHAADENPDLAAKTRWQLLSACADSGALLFPTHFGAPHVVRIKRTTDGFDFEFEHARLMRS